jgi:Zn-dependent protease with chaperone function
MSGKYPALARLRKGQKSAVEEQSESPSLFSSLFTRIHEQWKIRSARFLAGLLLFVSSILLFVISIVFLLGGLYATIKLFVGQIAALFVMGLISLLSGTILLRRSLRNLDESVDFSKKELDLKITD